MTSNHECGLSADGSVECRDRQGGLPAGSPEGSFRALATSDRHTCGIRTDGSLECWAIDSGGVLHAPGGLLDPPGGTFHAVSTARYHSCAVRTDGSLECWGLDYAGLLDAPSGRFRTVASGTAHSCAVRTDRRLQCWGTFRAPPAGVSFTESSTSIGEADPSPQAVLRKTLVLTPAVWS